MSVSTVCINVNTLNEPMLTGLGRYIYEIVARLGALCSQAGVSLELLYTKGTSPKLPENHCARPVEINAPRGSLTFLRGCAKHVKETDALYCNLAFGVPVNHGISTVHDVRRFFKSEFDTSRQRLQFRMIMRSIAMRARLVVTDSEFSKSEIKRYLHIKDERLRVIGCGWEHMASIEADESVLDRFQNVVSGEYYYTLSSLAPHKNMKWVKKVAERNPNSMFLVAGKKWPGIQEGEEGSKNVRFLGYVTDGESKALMTHCKAFLYPSLYDGFGIPPLEAASCGAKLIVSNAACIPEIYGGGYAHFVDPRKYDVDLESIMQNAAWPTSYADLLSRYSWDVAAAEWMRIIMECLK